MRASPPADDDEGATEAAEAGERELEALLDTSDGLAPDAAGTGSSVEAATGRGGAGEPASVPPSRSRACSRASTSAPDATAA